MRFAHSPMWIWQAALLTGVLLLSGCGKQPAPTEAAGKTDLPASTSGQPGSQPGPTPQLGPTPQPAPNPKAEIEELLSAKPDAEMTAQELIAEFKTSPSLTKYVGKVVDVTGKVSMYQYTHTGGDRPELFLSSLDIYFPCRQIDALARVAPGQTVTLRTRVQPLTGYTNCVIVKVEGPAPLELIADKLAEAYAKDKEGTQNEYKGKHVVLKGKARIIDGEAREVVLTSPGVKPEIVCRFGTDSAAVAKKHGWLKDGAEVHILCQSIVGDPNYFSSAVVRPPLK